jgi:hypothetical protein
MPHAAWSNVAAAAAAAAAAVVVVVVLLLPLIFLQRAALQVIGCAPGQKHDCS